MSGDLPLELEVELGEGHVPAEDELERAGRRGMAKVVPADLTDGDLGAQPVATVELDEGGVPPRFRQFAQAAFRVLGRASSAEDRVVDIGRENVQGNALSAVHQLVIESVVRGAIDHADAAQ